MFCVRCAVEIRRSVAEKKNEVCCRRFSVVVSIAYIERESAGIVSGIKVDLSG